MTAPRPAPLPPVTRALIAGHPVPRVALARRLAALEAGGLRVPLDLAREALIDAALNLACAAAEQGETARAADAWGIARRALRERSPRARIIAPAVFWGRRA